ncbi:transmembrane protein [Legionella sainthelensi]|uniref:Transmembrane protein n=1 Tax=Legionella sainthelensi TaxID=28087 RepID=A0A0W0YJK7_9GAMM|nr:DUF5336 domain-containing protein [Legionella sainthelensi]KTD57101.1 transmembrane protein [Legionella sainthelensi]VEH37620.1 transmembrane protein [Legionella sainthelensi]
MSIEDIIHHTNLHKPTEPPPLDSPIIQDINPQELILEVPKSKKLFINKHKKAIIAVSAMVLAAAVLGVVAFFAWPAVASAILGFGAYGLTLGAIAGANLIAQVGLVAAVFAVGGFIASGGLLTAGSKVINRISKAWDALYESPVKAHANFEPQPDPIANKVKKSYDNAGRIEKPSPLILPPYPPTPVAPSAGSVAFLTQMQQKKENFKRLVEINNQFINDDSLSDDEYTGLENESDNLGTDIQLGLSNQQNEEQHSPGLSIEIQATSLPQQESIMNIAEPLPQNTGSIKTPSPLSLFVPPTASVAPSTGSVTFFTQMQEKKDKCMRLVEINNQLLNGTLSKIEKRQLKTEIANLEEDILSNRQNKLGQNKQKEERIPSDLSNQFKDEYLRMRSCNESPIQTQTESSNIVK